MKKVFLSLVAVAILVSSCGTKTEAPADATQVDTLVAPVEVTADTVAAKPDSLVK